MKKQKPSWSIECSADATVIKVHLHPRAAQTQGTLLTIIKTTEKKHKGKKRR